MPPISVSRIPSLPVQLKHKLKRVYIVRDARGCGYINVEFYEQDASYMEIDMEQVYERVYKNRELSRNVCNVQVSAFQKLQDDYGQTFMTKTYATSMNKATANKVRDWLMVEQPNMDGPQDAPRRQRRAGPKRG